jgi:hypothetical protein
MVLGPVETRRILVWRTGDDDWRKLRQEAWYPRLGCRQVLRRGDRNHRARVQGIEDKSVARVVSRRRKESRLRAWMAPLRNRGRRRDHDIGSGA